jgi:hypothetical protein
MTTKEKKIIEKIAKESLQLDTLEERLKDELDFHEHAVWSIKEALERAYFAGKKAKK